MKPGITTLTLILMTQISTAQTWLAPDLYPFQPHFLETEHGKIHYVDEGEGEVLLFVHGTPTWSFLFRNYIRQLSGRYRCIALDHLGFGLSDKPRDFAGTPEAHAQNLNLLIETLGLRDITLLVHDFGGPIGLSEAIASPDRIQRVVLFNTWLWETESNPGAQKINRILHSPLGKFLYLYTNFSPAILLKKAFHQKKNLGKQLHRHYRKPFPGKSSRYGLLKIGQSLVGSSDWYARQWAAIDVLQDKPMLILWGMQDVFIGPEQLARWQDRFPKAEVHRFESGHFVQEEAFADSFGVLEEWLGQN